MPNVKPFQEHGKLLDMLSNNGLEITNRPLAHRELRRHGYHRLSGYRYLFRELLPSDKQDPKTRTFRGKRHKLGSRFEHTILVAEFDARLRECVSRGLADFEVRLRTATAHVLARRNELAHLETKYLDQTKCNHWVKAKKKTSHAIFRSEVQFLTERAIDEDDFAKHHSEKYGPDLPVWAVVEHLTFGNLIHLYGYMKSADRREVAREFGVQHPSTFNKWIFAMLDLRNYCSHNVRLFNKPLKRRITIPENATLNNRLDATRDFLESWADFGPDPRNRLYTAAAVLAYLLRSHIYESDWPLEFQRVVHSLPDIRLQPDQGLLLTPEKNMGFPAGWCSDILWSSGTDAGEPEYMI